jgi:AcrR family transcriptional regulator
MIDAALKLLTTEGAEALTIRAAARLAGVSHAAPYRHFADKQALLAAVAEEGFRAMVHAMRQARAAQASDPLARFRALGLAYVEFATGHPSYFRVMFGRATADRSAYPSLHEAARSAFDLLVEAITECQRAGVVSDGDPEQLALAGWSIAHGLSVLQVDGQLNIVGGPATESAAESITRTIFLGLAPR